MITHSRIAMLSTALALLIAPIMMAQTSQPLTYVNPYPGATFISPTTTITIRPANPVGSLDPSAITVRGVRSGSHAGRLKRSADGQTFIFAPDQAFLPGEAVTVDVNLAGGSQQITFTTSPLTEQPDPMVIFRSEMAADSRGGDPRQLGGQSDTTIPADFPKPVITVNDNPAPGDLFLASFVASGDTTKSPFIIQMDNAGTPKYYHRMPGRAFDFTHYPDGTMTYFDEDAGVFYQMNSAYQIIDSFACGNGYRTDLHDIILMPNKHVMLIGFYNSSFDMSTLVEGGDVNARLYNMLIQELDADRNVIFEWHSLAHFSPLDATHESMLNSVIDYMHPNSIEIDTDGNILLSSRHLDEVTKINRQTGDVIWHLGGKHNEFTFIGDTLRFSYQHDARRIANGHLMLYDNGNYHNPPHSRALEYEIDETAKTAKVVWQYRNTPDVYGMAMGSVRRLPNGNTMIGWGFAQTTATEVRPDGSKAFEMQLPRSTYSYRTLRFEASSSGVTPTPTSTDATTAIAPNPAREETNLQLHLSAPSHVSVDIVDVLGRVVATPIDRTIDGGDHNLRLDLHGLPGSGLYFYRVRSDEGKAEGRLVVVR